MENYLPKKFQTQFATPALSNELLQKSLIGWRDKKGPGYHVNIAGQQISRRRFHDNCSRTSTFITFYHHLPNQYMYNFMEGVVNILAILGFRGDFVLKNDLKNHCSVLLNKQKCISEICGVKSSLC